MARCRRRNPQQDHIGSGALFKKHEPLVSEWLGTATYNYSDYAAYRALILLRQTRREVYDGLDHDLWRKWAPLVAAVDRLTGGEEAELHDAIAEDACRAAPVEFAETVQKLICAERTKAPREPDKVQQLVPFFVLQRLEKCWFDPTVKEVVFAELRDSDNSPWQFRALLEPLLKAGFGPARELAITTLAEASPERREFVLAAAFGLASFSAMQVWTKIWALVLEREDIGKELFLQLAEHRRFEATFYVGLPEPALGAVYLWSEQKFPHNEDPVHISGVASLGWPARDGCATPGRRSSAHRCAWYRRISQDSADRYR